MPAGPKLLCEASLALECLKPAYQTTDIETVFIQAYEEFVGGPMENALFDFRLYQDGQTVCVPPYIERACKVHGVWPWA